MTEKEGLASWENEGGAQRAAASPRPVIAVASWPPRSVLESARPDPPRGADKGIVDTHTLGILRVSLLLIVPALGVMAMWSSSLATAGAD